MSGFTRQPVSDRDRAEKARIVQNMLRARRKVDLIFSDCADWNRLHPNEEPINPDPDGELMRWRKWLDAQLDGEVQ